VAIPRSGRYSGDGGYLSADGMELIGNGSQQDNRQEENDRERLGSRLWKRLKPECDKHVALSGPNAFQPDWIIGNFPFDR